MVYGGLYVWKKAVDAEQGCMLLFQDDKGNSERSWQQESCCWEPEEGVLIQYREGFDMIPRTRLRREWSQMPCNLVNFILVNRESEVG